MTDATTFAGDQKTIAVWQADTLKVDRVNRHIWLEGKPVSLSGKPFDLLVFLMSQAGTLSGKDEIIHAVWDGRAVSDAVLTTAIKQIRQALGDPVRGPRFIETVHGKGYRFLQAVTTVSPASPQQGTAGSPLKPAPARRAKSLSAAGLIAAIALIALMSAILTPTTHDTPPRSIAVLPFDDLTPENNMRWFADGVAEEVLNALARIPDIDVSARRASFRFRAHDRAMASIGKSLGVAHILEGSVRREGDRIRVTAQLIRASDGFHIWSENYDRPHGDMIDIQEEIALKIARTFQTSTDPEALSAMLSAGTQVITAYQTYLEGRQMEERFSETLAPEDWQAGLRLYDKARRLDPTFAEAHIRAATAWLFAHGRSLATIGEPLPPAAFLEGYLERVDGAISHARTEADKIYFRAFQAEILFRLSEARTLYEEFLETYPNHIDALGSLANILNLMGDFTAQRAVLRRMEALVKDDVFEKTIVIQGYNKARDFGAAIRLFNSISEKDRNNSWLLYTAQTAYRWHGDHETASSLTARIEATGISPARKRALMVMDACARGDRASALAALDQPLSALAGNPGAFRLLLMLGEEDAAYEGIKSLDRRVPPVLVMPYAFSPGFDRSRLPGLKHLIERGGGRLPPPLAIPYRCPN